MEIKTCTDYPDDVLEKYRSNKLEVDWFELAEGYWGRTRIITVSFVTPLPSDLTAYGCLMRRPEKSASMI